ncbi:MAG: ArsR/SmtB family transcription factor [Caldilineaceae bacterium]
MDTIFTVLAEPNRRRILDLLRDGPRPVNDLVGALELSQPAVSKHLRILREAGLVESVPVGRQHLYSLRAEPLRRVDDWLATYRRHWEERFDRLEEYLRTLQALEENHAATDSKHADDSQL